MTEPPSNRAVMVVLAYLWPLALIPFVVARDDPEAHWHAKHGLVLGAAELVVLFAASIVVSVASLAAFSLGCALSVAMILLWIAILVVHLAAMLKALNGTRLIVPGVSTLADRF